MNIGKTFTLMVSMCLCSLGCKWKSKDPALISSVPPPHLTPQGGHQGPPPQPVSFNTTFKAPNGRLEVGAANPFRALASNAPPQWESQDIDLYGLWWDRALQDIAALFQEQGPSRPPLHLAEGAALRFYSGMGARLVNTYLREATQPSPLLNALVQLTVSATNQLPPLTTHSLVYRGAVLQEKEIENYVVGKTYQEKAFFSSSLINEYVEKVFTKNVVFTIKCVTGKSIEAYSALPHQKEVIFIPGTVFQVVKKKKDWKNV